MYLHELAADENGRSFAAVVNRKLGLGVVIDFDASLFPYFMEWKSTGAGDYVVGLEPSNSSVHGRGWHEQRGDLHAIAPQASERERTQPARDLAMQLPPDDGSVTRVLDIGCGPGNSTAVLRERYPHAKILGVDSSPVMIETARKTYPDIDFQLCDVSARLDELPADFDVVFSNACIQWVPDHPHLIPGLLARLRVGECWLCRRR